VVRLVGHFDFFFNQFLPSSISSESFPGVFLFYWLVGGNEGLPVVWLSQPEICFSFTLREQRIVPGHSGSVIQFLLLPSLVRRTIHLLRGFFLNIFSLLLTYFFWLLLRIFNLSILSSHLVFFLLL